MPEYNEAYIVDDDTIYSFVAGKILEKSNIFKKITIFNTGENAISHLKSLKPKDHPYAIFLDLVMPGMDGMEFYRTLQKLPAFKNVIIFIHSATMNKKALHPFEAKKIKIFTKPLKIDEVKKLLEK